MFERKLKERNPGLLSAAIELHQSGAIPAGSYLLDLDAMSSNAGIVTAEAHRLGLRVVAMTKQFGRNPVAMAALRDAGVDAFVAVDMDCARAIDAAGQPLGHLGHLVQVPRGEAVRAAAMRPQSWSVVDLIKGHEAGAAAAAQGLEQPLLARIFGAFDVTTPTHLGGFAAEKISDVAEQLSTLDGARFAGITSYPALTFDPDTRQVRPTHNLGTLTRASNELRSAGFNNLVVNAPGETTSAGLSLLAEAGVTDVEPGHAFTGTTIGHAFLDLPEVPAMVYVSEVSHLSGSLAMCFGGGLYRCIGNAGAPRAFVGRTGETSGQALLDSELTSADVIDFYGRLRVQEGDDVRAGDSAVFCFRAQVFYTRAHVVPVRGISAGTPEVLGVFGPDGFPAQGWS